MKKEVLVAEDEPGLNRTISMILRSDGWTVDSCENGMQAFEKASGRDYDLLVTDIEMPQLDGVGLVERLAEHHIEVPTLVISGYGSAERVYHLSRLGCSHFVDKPFTSSGLREKIAALLASSSAQIPLGINIERLRGPLSYELQSYEACFGAMRDNSHPTFIDYTPNRAVAVDTRSLTKGMQSTDLLLGRATAVGYDLLVADASGETMEDALKMQMIKAYFVHNCINLNEIDKFMLFLNSALMQRWPNKPVYALYLRFITAEHRLQISAAAHESPLLLKGGSEMVLPLRCGGQPLAQRAQGNYILVEHTLTPGDRLVAFSDGLTALAHTDNGTNPLLLSASGVEMLIRQHVQQPREALLERVWNGALSFAGEQAGGNALLSVIEYTGREAGEV
jgi:DNA-binding response OmpR family regulator